MFSLLPRELCLDRSIVQAFAIWISPLAYDDRKICDRGREEQQIFATACTPSHNGLSQALCLGVHNVCSTLN
jgi:hypothetical protein